MFVKIVKTSQMGKEIRTVESTYQCGSVSFRDVESKALDALTGDDVPIVDLMIQLEGCPAAHDGFMAHQCEKKGLGVYVMNDEGKTIDRYHFS